MKLRVLDELAFMLDHICVAFLSMFNVACFITPLNFAFYLVVQNYFIADLNGYKSNVDYVSDFLLNRSEASTGETALKPFINLKVIRIEYLTAVFQQDHQRCPCIFTV